MLLPLKTIKLNLNPTSELNQLFFTCDIFRSNLLLESGILWDSMAPWTIWALIENKNFTLFWKYLFRFRQKIELELCCLHPIFYKVWAENGVLKTCSSE